MRNNGKQCYPEMRKNFFIILESNYSNSFKFLSKAIPTYFFCYIIWVNYVHFFPNLCGAE